MGIIFTENELANVKRLLRPGIDATDLSDDDLKSDVYLGAANDATNRQVSIILSVDADAAQDPVYVTDPTVTEPHKRSYRRAIVLTTAALATRAIAQKIEEGVTGFSERYETIDFQSRITDLESRANKEIGFLVESGFKSTAARAKFTLFAVS